MCTRTRPIWLALGGLWLSAIIVGLRVLLTYETTPGDKPQTPTSESWPANSALNRVAGRKTLVVIAHPRCGCTRATIGELEKVLARVTEAPVTFMLFLNITFADRDPNKGALWRAASALPGVQIFTDQSGAEARLFGASTSGQTLLFDERGRLLFRGGITSSRGHAGDNAGSDAVINLLNHKPPARQSSFVFGCALFADRGD